MQNLHKIYEQQTGGKNVASSPNPGYNKNKSRSGMNSNTRATSKMIVDHNHGGLMDGRRNSDDIINGLYQQQQQALITSQNLPAGTTSNIMEGHPNAQNKSSGKQLMGQQAPSSATGTTHFNNKIIINQQHYFTDSIKIYQNGSGNTNLAGTNAAEGQPNFHSQLVHTTEEPRRMKQGGAYPTTQQSINSSLGSSAMPNAAVANSSRVNSRLLPGSSGRHSSMHEYVQNGLNGLSVPGGNIPGAQLGAGGGGQAQFSQMPSGTGQNFQDIINSSQKVIVPNPNSSAMLNHVQGNQKKFLQQQNHAKIFQTASSQHKKNLSSSSYTTQKTKKMLQPGGANGGGGPGSAANQSIQGNQNAVHGLQSSVQRGSRVGSLLHDNSIHSQTSQGGIQGSMHMTNTSSKTNQSHGNSNYGSVKRQQRNGSGNIR